jgi:hypothetical protein
LADARAALERAMDNIDREVMAAKERSEETKREYEAIRATAAERKQASAQDRKNAIRARLDALA